MDLDPWNWSVDDVQRFFRDEAFHYISDMPRGQLPPLDSFCNSLQENDVTGAILLTIVDSSALRDDFQIKSLGIRGTVVHCIVQLRRNSARYQAQQDPQSLRTPLSLPVRALPTVTTPQEPVLSATETAGEHVRPGEVQIQDAHGRKRRKLNMSNVEPLEEAEQPPAEQSPAERSPAVGFLADAAGLVDDLFYGSTDFGGEVGNLESNGNVLILQADRNAGLADVNFQSAYQNKSVGEAEFVYVQMRHFLVNAEEVDLRRQGRDALGVLPYRDGLQHGSRSATVLQFRGDEEEPVAIRENAAHLESGYVPDENVQRTHGEWEFLEQKYNDKHDAVLPLYGDSESGDIESTMSTSEGNAEQMAEEEEEASTLSRDRVAEIIENAINECIAVWHKGLQELEEKKAWSVWKRTKQSRILREQLIESAHAKIDHFTVRLNKLKDELLSNIWSNEQSLLKAFATLETTIEDREEQQWMICVWRRRQEPAHVVHHGASASRHALQTPASDKAAGPGFVVHPNDRFSVSPAPTPAPAPITPVEVDNTAVEDEIQYEADDEFHTPIGTPEVSTGAYPELDTPDNITLGSNDEDEEESSEEQHTEQSVKEDMDVDMTHIDHIDDYKDDSYSQGDAESDNDELPSPSTFISQRKRPDKPEISSTSRTTAIDLTMLSSDSSPPNRKGRASSTSARPSTDPSASLNATAAEVDSWDFATLRRENDRWRLLIKLLSLTDTVFRDRLDACRKPLPEFIDKMKVALLGLNDVSEDTETSKIAEVMRETARFYLLWQEPTRSEQDARNFDQKHWDSVLDVSQMRMFSNMLGTILFNRNTKLFNAIKNTPSKHSSSKHSPSKHSSSKPTSSAIIEISSSDDKAHHQDTPHRKRKKQVRMNEAAKDSRKSAFDRLQRHQESQSQATDSSQLAAMIASNPSASHIAINPAKADGDEYVFICDRIARSMKAHQIEGVHFLWREITADGEQGSQGCILAHTMGLGKTMQTIALLVAVNEAAQSNEPTVYRQLPEHLRPKGIRGKRRLRVMILCPPSLIQNWGREIDRWAPNQLGEIFSLDSGKRASHLQQLELWMKKGGVVLLGYQMFRSTVNRKARNPEKKGTMPEDDYARMEKLLLEGPDIVVADEAHYLKNNKSNVATAAERFTTESRIGLTGTPMSNDVQEIYALVSWVAPNYLGDQQEFYGRYSAPIQDGLYHDSSAYEKRVSIKKLKVLHAEIQPKVNRANIEALRGSLRPKIEFVITVPLGEVQAELYKRYVRAFLRSDTNKNASQVTIFGWLGILTLLANHPHCFRQKLLSPSPARKSKKGKQYEAIAEATSRDNTPSAAESGSATPSHAGMAAEEQLMDPDVAKEVPGDEPIHTLGFTEEMVQSILSGFEDDVDPTLSAKVDIFLKLLEYSRECGDKALVFTTSIPTMEFLDDLFRQTGKPFGRIDGQTAMAKRTRILEDFHHGDFDIMLVSTRAGGVGLNIQGANRVFIFDFGFNPTWEEQAIGRAYRLGQTKPVYVYRFIAGGTFETNIYNKQLFKTSLAQRVVDKKNPRRAAERNTREYLYEPKDVPQRDLAEWIGKDPKVLDRLLLQHGPGSPGKIDSRIRELSTMETLQEEVMDVPLNEEEQQEVNKEIEQSRQRPRGRKGAPASSAMPPPPPASNFARGRDFQYPSTAPAQPGPLPSTSNGIVRLPITHGLPLPKTPKTQPPRQWED